MKKLAALVCFLALVFAAATERAGGQRPNGEGGVTRTVTQAGAPFDGDWTGSITTDGRDFPVRIVIRGNTATQYFRGDNGWDVAEPDRVSFLINKNNAALVWLNSGGAWSETQVYSLSYVNPTRLDVVWSRHVNNVRDGSDNQTWNKQGTGTLRKN